jgi:hypothetical protein
MIAADCPAKYIARTSRFVGMRLATGKSRANRRNRTMMTTIDINKVLVVLNPDLIRSDNPEESPLIRRAVGLAKSAGCEIELFHACYDSMIDYTIVASHDERQRQRETITDRDATLLAEIAARLSIDGVKVSCEAATVNLLSLP